MTKPATALSSPADDPILTIDEVAQRLRLPAKSVGNFLRDGAFPGAFKAGTGPTSKWRIPTSAVAAFIAERQAARQTPTQTAAVPATGRAGRVANRAVA